MKKAIVFLADGFEEIEAVGTVDYLRRSGIETTIVSIKDEKVTSARNVTIVADAVLNSFDISPYDAIILPGGLKGAENLRDDPRVINAVKDFYSAGKLVAAICAAPIIFDKAEILEGKHFTVYKSLKDNIKNGNYQNTRAVTDGNIITASGAGSVFAFAHEIVAYLVDEQTADKNDFAMIVR